MPDEWIFILFFTNVTNLYNDKYKVKSAISYIANVTPEKYT